MRRAISVFAAHDNGHPNMHDLADADAAAHEMQGIAVTEHDGDADQRERDAEHLVAREVLAQEQRRAEQRDRRD